MHHSARGPHRADLQQVRSRRATRVQSCAILLPHHNCYRTHDLVSWLRFVRRAGLALVVLCTTAVDGDGRGIQGGHPRNQDRSCSCAALDPCSARHHGTEYRNPAVLACVLTS